MNIPEDENIKIEKRREPRSNNVFVDYSPGEEDSQKVSTFAKNISACGICILLLENIEVNTTLFLTIHLPDREGPIHVKGKAIWIKPLSFLSTKGKNHFEAGLEYVDINDADQARILQNVVRFHEINSNGVIVEL